MGSSPAVDPRDGRRLIAVGLSHRTAPVEIRERVALDEAGVRAQLAKLRVEVAPEALIVSTCNRVELWVSGPPEAAARVREWFAELRGRGGEAVDKYLTWRDGRDAIVHLFRVASSLDSLVVGEPQILGQVKDAIRVAEEAGTLGATLGPLARRTLSVAKRVRTDTAIGRYRVGVGNAGVDLAKQIFGDLGGRRAMLLGVGEMGRQVAKALLDAGLSELIVANRTYDTAVEVATEYRGTAIAMERVDEYLAQVDIVIAATGAQHALIGPDAVKRALRARRYHPLFLVDLSVPRNIDPAVADLEEAYLFNVDDLAQVLERGREARDDASRDAQRIIDEEADRFVQSLRAIEIGPAIGRLTRHVEALRQAEIARSGRLVGGLDADQREQLDAMTKAFARKVLDGAVHALRDAAKDGDQGRVEAILALWPIDEEEKP